LESVVKAWLAVEGREAAASIVDRIRAAVRLTADQSVPLAELLTAEGHPDAATILWCQVVTAPEAGIKTRWQAAQELLASGGAAHAEQALRTALTAPRDADEALLLRRLLAWVRPPANQAGENTAKWSSAPSRG
jgi:hypothetical protein